MYYWMTTTHDNLIKIFSFQDNICLLCLNIQAPHEKIESMRRKYEGRKCGAVHENYLDHKFQWLQEIYNCEILAYDADVAT